MAIGLNGERMRTDHQQAIAPFRRKYIDAPQFPAAACVGTEPSMWYAESSEGEDAAKRVCAGCPELTACHTYALAHEEFGVWGGMSAGERRKLRRELGIRMQRVIDVR